MEVTTIGSDRDVLDDLRDDVLAVIRERGLRRLAAPVQLSSGHHSQHFVDAKRALARGADLTLACRALLALAERRGVEFEAVGGLTMGADQFAHGMAIVGDKRWFVVRKEPKGRGTDQLIEGADLSSGVPVLLVEDVVTTGASIGRAQGAVRQAGAPVVLAVALVDRGDTAALYFEGEGIAYEALLTYHDLGIPPVGGV